MISPARSKTKCLCMRSEGLLLLRSFLGLVYVSHVENFAFFEKLCSFFSMQKGLR